MKLEDIFNEKKTKQSIKMYGLQLNRCYNFIAIHAYILKIKAVLNKLSFYLKNFKKNEQIKF